MAFPVTTIPPSSGGGGSSAFGDITGWPGAATDFVRGDGTDGPLSATDIPTGVDATKLADGSVTNTELQYIGTLTSNAQTQLNGKQAAATGTPDGTKYLRDDNSWQAVIASDATKLPLAGGTVSGDILTSVANRIGPSTTDGADNITVTFGYSGPTRGGRVICHGNESATPGRVQLGGGSASSTARVDFLDFGGGVGMYWDGFAGGFFSGGNGWYAQNILTVTATLTANGTLVLGSTTALASTSNGAWTETNATCIQAGQGCLAKISKLVSRANSTAYSLCPCPAGDVLRVLLQDSSSKRALALVDASGTVTFESGSHADYVASSSPASGEVGVYVTASVLTIKPGSAGTRSIAASIERARA